MSIRRGLLVALSAAMSVVPLAAARAQDGQVIFERTGYRLTSLGARVAVAARVLDSRRRAVPNAPIAWRIQDPDVASVNSRGEVVSRRPGRTRVWAVSGGDSASALILVDQWAAKFTFNPALLRFNAVDERRTLQVQARDASGNQIPGIRATVACRVLNERIASMSPSGQLQAHASGVTYVRCADRGVADSVRVEVRQRPVRASITDKGAFASRTVGDTFQIRMAAVDAEGRPIADARPTWASLDSRVVNIDPLTGRARAVSPGLVKIVAQVGDITDTVSVGVAAGAGIMIPQTPVAAEGETAAAPTEAAAARPALRVLAAFPSVGDTTRVDVDVRGQGGTPVDIGSVKFHSSDESVMKSLGSGRIVAVKVGEAYLVGSYSTMTDSALITVSPKGSRSSVALAGASSFLRPSYDTVAALNRNRTQLDSARRNILAGSVVKTASGHHLAMEGIVAQASHATHVTDAVIESRTGLMYGGRMSAAWFRRLPVTAHLLTGTLVGEKTAKVEDMTLTEANAQVTFAPVPAFGLRAGYTLRTENTPTAVLKWTFVEVGALSRLQFVGGKIGTFAAISILPVSQVFTNATTSDKADPTSLSGEAGLEARTGFLSAALGYYVERFTFPVKNGNQRKDEFSMLRIRIGVQAGR